jgi:hypothetical protein
LIYSYIGRDDVALTYIGTILDVYLTIHNDAVISFVSLNISHNYNMVSQPMEILFEL